ncbi:hypothetical protein CANARDRAFT_175208 [[Candida] arabinofermentans NRRL YB-2248]|uniref:Uncharacterized protein n=1 Tax=[Candida] arabinofermentans NRRL YB-2248 TaxID=983967 RepID=A0A1E4T3P6_9ASCO|nr:hypothetical protein CANARDRAFT_175208 [[Candida] arabinofermentans NRRL YB-2248]
MSRPQVTVVSLEGKTTSTALPLPAVFKAPIRPDIVHSVFTKINKNKRQAYAVAENAGHQTSAESWGTGRAVARIPRVGGGGTHRSGQAAFGNMCRGGRMFAPTKIWRKWHVKVNHNEKRYATASAIAASAVQSLVLARGHRVEAIPEIPLVVSSELENVQKTKEAVAALKAVGAHKDVIKVIKSKKMRAGKGKLRGRRFTQRRGPLVVYAQDNGLVKAFRNVPGVETANVKSLGLLQLAPGAHLGRFIIWTESAFAALDSVYGSETTASSKSGYSLPANIISNTDVTRIINSAEIQAVVRPAGQSTQKRTHVLKKNPLKNKQVLLRLNPYAKAFAEKKLGSAKSESKGEKPSKGLQDTCKDSVRRRKSTYRKRSKQSILSEEEPTSKNFESTMANDEYVQLTDLLNTNPPSPSEGFFYDESSIDSSDEDFSSITRRPFIEINMKENTMISSYPNNSTPNSYVYNSKHSSIRNTAKMIPSDLQDTTNYTSPLIMRHVIKTPDDIYLTNIVKAYRYPAAYHALISYLKQRFSQEQLIEIAKCMAKYRPSFISATKNLVENDLIFTERSFQRTLLEYESLIAMSPSPTIIWRRTGEIVALTNEFAVMTGYSKMSLLSKRTFIVELMDDESTIRYFRSFSAFAFGDLNATHLTDCSLRKADEGDYLRCCCVWTIKRDVFDIPMLIVGQFLPVLD